MQSRAFVGETEGAASDPKSNTREEQRYHNTDGKLKLGNCPTFMTITSEAAKKIVEEGK